MYSINGGDVLKITIQNTSGIPIYEQIKDQIRSLIYLGTLKESEGLPSIRQLAKDLQISVITTTRAYNDLESEGLITSVQGKGFYVCPRNMEMIREKSLREIEGNLFKAVQAAKNARIEKKEFIEILKVIVKEEEYE